MVNRNALTPLFSLRRDIDRLWEDAFGATGSEGTRWMPAADVQENDSEFVFEFELPGIKAENVDITAENGVLTVRGEKRSERTEGEQEGRYHLVERSYGSFTRSFQLPQGVDEEKIQADFDNGLLRVTVPKGAKQKARRIQIGSRREIQSGAAKQETGKPRGAERTVNREPASETRA